MVSPKGAVLILEAVWEADQDDLEKAKIAIASRYPDAEAPQLDYANLNNASAALTIALPDGSVHSIGPKMSSGIQPNRVVFNEALTSPEKTAAVSAFGGQKGFLTLTYTGQLSLDEVASAEIKGDLASVVQKLAPKEPPKSTGFLKKKPVEPPPLPNQQQCEEAVKDAIQQGVLTLDRKDSNNVPDDLKERTESDLVKRVATMLFEKLKSLGENAAYLKTFAISQSASESAPARYTVTSCPVDLGEWLARTGIKPTINETSADLPEPSR
jgi:hypothetical protein